MMDIHGLVNHNNSDDRRLRSLSPPENSGSESARSYVPAESVIPQPSLYAFAQRDREETYAPHYQLHNSTERTTSPPSKRPLERLSPTLPNPPPKRQLRELNGLNGVTSENGKSFPTRRRALQACEACRAKKSKCDNERPSCGSCIQHGVECVYKGAPFVPVLDAASMVLLEKLNKLEATMGEQTAILAQVQEATSFLEPNFPFKNNFKTPFCPTQPPSRSCEDCGEAFLVPKGRWASINYFMTLPFVVNLMPAGSKLETIVRDNVESSRDTCKFPDLHPANVQKLVETYLTGIHPMHPVLEIATIERIKKELDEDGLCWNGETAIILLVLAIACVISGQDSLEYHSAAKRRLGFAVDSVGHLSIQAHYLQGLYWHLRCQPIRAARSFNHASINAYLYFKAMQKDYVSTDLDKRLFWGCIKMETRYVVDVDLPDSGLASLELVTELTDDTDANPAKRHASRFDLFIWRFALYSMTIVYNSQYPNLHETERLESLEKDLAEWHAALHSPANELKPGPVKTGLQLGYEAVDFLIHRPFTQFVLTQSTLPGHKDFNAIPSSIASRAQHALEIAIKHVSTVRKLQIVDWFNIKQVFLATLLVIAASKAMDEDTVLQKEAMDTLNGATEIFARAAKSSESAKMALQLISEIRVSLKVNGA